MKNKIEKTEAWEEMSSLGKESTLTTINQVNFALEKNKLPIKKNKPLYIISFGSGWGLEALRIFEYYEKIGQKIEYIGLDIYKKNIDCGKLLHKDYKNINFHVVDASKVDKVKEILGDKKIDLALFIHPETTIQYGAVYYFYLLFYCKKTDVVGRVNAFEKMITEVLPEILDPNGAILTVTWSKQELDDFSKFLKQVTDTKITHEIDEEKKMYTTVVKNISFKKKYEFIPHDDIKDFEEIEEDYKKMKMKKN